MTGCFAPRDSADLYEIVTAPHQTASIVLTSNRDPSECLPKLADPLLAQALVAKQPSLDDAAPKLLVALPRLQPT